MVWRGLFDRAASIEQNPAAVNSFAGGMTEGSMLFQGNSRSPVTAKGVADELGSAVDMLFIDGDHGYNSVQDDYANYEPLVRKGGIVAFHDSIAAKPVKQFLQEFADGSHVLTPSGLDLVRIGLDNGVGITYYVKD